MKEKIWSWGYVLDKAPTAAPFVFGKTRCSLETASRYLGAGKTFYMNSMFSADFMRKHFPDTEDECIANCIGNRLSDSHMKLLSDIPEIYCTLEHGRREASGRRIAELSLKYGNIKGVNFDDFNNGAPETDIKPEELREFRAMIRSINPDIPIIFLTAKTMKEDILEGFKIGADDYLTKPFSMEELLLRIEAILRRVKGKKMKDIPFYKLGNFLFDTQKQTLTIGEKITKLTTKECELLSLLCAHANEILERNYALKTIWVDDNYFNARSMDVYITKLRKLLRDDPGIEIINIHGKGYKLITPSGDEQAREEGIQVL